VRRKAGGRKAECLKFEVGNLRVVRTKILPMVNDRSVFSKIKKMDKLFKDVSPQKMYGLNIQLYGISIHYGYFI